MLDDRFANINKTFCCALQAVHKSKYRKQINKKYCARKCMTVHIYIPL